MDQCGKELARIDAMGCIVRTSINAARLFLVGAEITGRGLGANFSDFAAGLREVIDCNLERMHVDVSIRTVIRAETATDAPVFNDDFQAVAAANRSHWASHHAQWVLTVTTRGGYQILIPT